MTKENTSEFWFEKTYLFKFAVWLWKYVNLFLIVPIVFLFVKFKNLINNFLFYVFKYSPEGPITTELTTLRITLKNEMTNKEIDEIFEKGYYFFLLDQFIRDKVKNKEFFGWKATSLDCFFDDVYEILKNKSPEPRRPKKWLEDDEWREWRDAVWEHQRSLVPINQAFVDFIKSFPINDFYSPRSLLRRINRKLRCFYPSIFFNDRLSPSLIVYKFLYNSFFSITLRMAIFSFFIFIYILILLIINIELDLNFLSSLNFFENLFYFFYQFDYLNHLVFVILHNEKYSSYSLYAYNLDELKIFAGYLYNKYYIISTGKFYFDQEAFLSLRASASYDWFIENTILGERRWPKVNIFSPTYNKHTESIILYIKRLEQSHLFFKTYVNSSRKFFEEVGKSVYYNPSNNSLRSTGYSLFKHNDFLYDNQFFSNLNTDLLMNKIDKNLFSNNSWLVNSKRKYLVEWKHSYVKGYKINYNLLKNSYYLPFGICDSELSVPVHDDINLNKFYSKRVRQSVGYENAFCVSRGNIFKSVNFLNYDSEKSLLIYIYYYTFLSICIFLVLASFFKLLVKIQVISKILRNKNEFVLSHHLHLKEFFTIIFIFFFFIYIFSFNNSFFLTEVLYNFSLTKKFNHVILFDIQQLFEINSKNLYKYNKYKGFLDSFSQQGETQNGFKVFHKHKNSIFKYFEINYFESNSFCRKEAFDFYNTRKKINNLRKILVLKDVELKITTNFLKSGLGDMYYKHKNYSYSIFTERFFGDKNFFEKKKALELYSYFYKKNLFIFGRCDGLGVGVITPGAKNTESLKLIESYLNGIGNGDISNVEKFRANFSFFLEKKDTIINYYRDSFSIFKSIVQKYHLSISKKDELETITNVRDMYKQAQIQKFWFGYMNDHDRKLLLNEKFSKYLIDREKLKILDLDTKVGLLHTCVTDLETKKQAFVFNHPNPSCNENLDFGEGEFKIIKNPVPRVMQPLHIHREHIDFNALYHLKPMSKLLVYYYDSDLTQYCPNPKCKNFFSKIDYFSRGLIHHNECDIKYKNMGILNDPHRCLNSHYTHSYMHNINSFQYNYLLEHSHLDFFFYNKFKNIGRLKYYRDLVYGDFFINCFDEECTASDVGIYKEWHHEMDFNDLNYFYLEKNSKRYVSFESDLQEIMKDQLINVELKFNKKIINELFNSSFKGNIGLDLDQLVDNFMKSTYVNTKFMPYKIMLLTHRSPFYFLSYDQFELDMDKYMCTVPDEIFEIYSYYIKQQDYFSLGNNYFSYDIMNNSSRYTDVVFDNIIRKKIKQIAANEEFSLIEYKAVSLKYGFFPDDPPPHLIVYNYNKISETLGLLGQTKKKGLGIYFTLNMETGEKQYMGLKGAIVDSLEDRTPALQRKDRSLPPHNILRIMDPLGYEYMFELENPTSKYNESSQQKLQAFCRSYPMDDVNYIKSGTRRNGALSDHFSYYSKAVKDLRGGLASRFYDNVRGPIEQNFLRVGSKYFVDPSCMNHLEISKKIRNFTPKTTFFDSYGGLFYYKCKSLIIDEKNRHISTIFRIDNLPYMFKYENNELVFYYLKSDVEKNPQSSPSYFRIKAFPNSTFKPFFLWDIPGFYNSNNLSLYFDVYDSWLDHLLYKRHTLRNSPAFRKLLSSMISSNGYDQFFSELRIKDDSFGYKEGNNIVKWASLSIEDLKQRGKLTWQYICGKNYVFGCRLEERNINNLTKSNFCSPVQSPDSFIHFDIGVEDERFLEADYDMYSFMNTPEYQKLPDNLKDRYIYERTERLRLAFNSFIERSSIVYKQEGRNGISNIVERYEFKVDFNCNEYEERDFFYDREHIKQKAFTGIRRYINNPGIEPSILNSTKFYVDFIRQQLNKRLYYLSVYDDYTVMQDLKVRFHRDIWFKDANNLVEFFKKHDYKEFCANRQFYYVLKEEKKILQLALRDLNDRWQVRYLMGYSEEQLDSLRKEYYVLKNYQCALKIIEERRNTRNDHMTSQSNIRTNLWHAYDSRLMPKTELVWDEEEEGYIIKTNRHGTELERRRWLRFLYRKHLIKSNGLFMANYVNTGGAVDNSTFLSSDIQSDERNRIHGWTGLEYEYNGEEIQSFWNDWFDFTHWLGLNRAISGWHVQGTEGLRNYERILSTLHFSMVHEEIERKIPVPITPDMDLIEWYLETEVIRLLNPKMGPIPFYFNNYPMTGSYFIESYQHSMCYIKTGVCGPYHFPRKIPCVVKEYRTIEGVKDMEFFNNSHCPKIRTIEIAGNEEFFCEQSKRTELPNIRFCREKWLDSL